MVSTLVVEDGSLVDGADSYISLEDARSYALSRGISLSATDATADVQLRQAFDYVESYRNRYRGSKTVSTQYTQWPRVCAYVDGYEISSAVIPDLLRYAQVQLAAVINSGVDILPVGTGQFVTREKVGPIETQFSESINTSGMPTLPSVNQFLAPLLRDSAGIVVERA